ncbi:glycosyltransferase [Parapedobacter sp. ISTM3]|uniref:glycosyltransferase n=1 Tax=Parapedobacter sp. ISTM3 TaxID=2800130 RepID=UPI001903EE2C|nr:glycosyltransferase [Parapedobacter sp. ISTM3]MBK1441655.1 glycosyltransferase [Parapedobacter sp. ISTM3]
MKILFICGSLEPGKDGVGDYTRRLSAELIRQGHSASIMSIHDKYVSQTSSTHQQDSRIQALTIRIPRKMTWKQRAMEAAKFVADIDPDWISLQYVPYSFHSKGLPFGMLRFVKKLSKRPSWHIMFHELWVEPKTTKSKLICFFQASIIRLLVHTIKPKVVHTHLPLYESRLRSIGCEALPLPLFSNIKKNTTKKRHLSSNRFRIIFFSQISSNKLVFDFLKSIANEILDSGLSLEIIYVGNGTRLKPEIKAAFSTYQLTSYTRFSGFLSESEVSSLLLESNLAITPLPTQYLGKSGTIAAYIEHNLPIAAPIISTMNEKPVLGIYGEQAKKFILLQPSLKAIREMEEEGLVNCLSISEITSKFITDLASRKMTIK